MARRNRVSEVISARQADELWVAGDFARQIGQPLSAFLTVHWTNCPAGQDQSVQDRQGRIQTCIRRWLERRNVDLAAVWVIEDGPIGSGLHSHMLLHVPPEHMCEFAKMLPKWTGAPAIDKVTWPTAKAHTVAVGDEGAWMLDRVYDHGAGLRRYILKGCADRFLKYGIRHQPQGKIRGKRCGFSNSLGPVARARATQSLECP